MFQEGIWECAQLGGGQSGGYKCAWLWQAWGVLEAREEDYEAARRCFSRALDADNFNVATITAWTQMEEELGNIRDARSIFERKKNIWWWLPNKRSKENEKTLTRCCFVLRTGSLKQFSPGSAEKHSLWRAYELLEQRTGDSVTAQQVYQRSMRDIMIVEEEEIMEEVSWERFPPLSLLYSSVLTFCVCVCFARNLFLQEHTISTNENPIEEVLRKSNEVEVVRWGDTLGGEVWLNEGSIEAKMPRSAMKKNRPKKARNADTE